MRDDFFRVRLKQARYARNRALRDMATRCWLGDAFWWKMLIVLSPFVCGLTDNHTKMTKF